jgi:hypothetical protein
MRYDKNLLRAATKQYLQYISLEDGYYERPPKTHYRRIYGFAAEDAVNISSPSCILPELISQYEDTSFNCAANDEFFAYIALYDDMETSKWQYAISMVLSRIHREHSRKIYTPNRYVAKIMLAAGNGKSAAPCYKIDFHCDKSGRWSSFATPFKKVPCDIALLSEMELFRSEMIREMESCVSANCFISKNIGNVEIRQRGQYISFVEKNFAIYLIIVSADAPLEFKVIVFLR